MFKIRDRNKSKYDCGINLSLQVSYVFLENVRYKVWGLQGKTENALTIDRGGKKILFVDATSELFLDVFTIIIVPCRLLF